MHVITGQIRKAPYTQEGQNQKGAWKMYAVELSETWKDFKTQDRKYTNYRATLFASSPGSIQYYDEVLVEGAIVSISCDQLQINQREHNGTNYVTLELVNPKLAFAKAPEAAQQQAQQKQRPQQQQQRQSKPAQQQQQKSNNEPPVNFDDDIPF